jgi:DNA-binding winged helix-turn-helix (wHTH) protein
MPLKFDDWTYDAESRELRRGSEPVHVARKVFDLLGALLAASPRALSKAELQERLWPDTFVSEVNLAGLVADLRGALDDRARPPRFVRTVHSFGYAFCGNVVETPPGVRPGLNHISCRLIWGPREVVLGAGDNVVGRAPEAAAWVDSTTVSRHHARIRVGEGGATLEDLDSKNGTFLRGERLTGPTPLADGDEIRVGSVQMTFRLQPVAGSTDTQ